MPRSSGDWDRKEAGASQSDRQTHRPTTNAPHRSNNSNPPNERASGPLARHPGPGTTDLGVSSYVPNDLLN
ncbi:hypothetical protein AAFF_G00311310 [Aldrovandia affinis]|uniref:Uncharacterized protein n=1 Tax=Aldrovandia affinis TaxID=143900 RepID=A0AAD7VZY7_9TELE|nr:hypothetical protein AAFF_G00311310 [Aldrovandia affinis]